jgi:hypothetical protein
VAGVNDDVAVVIIIDVAPRYDDRVGTSACRPEIPASAAGEPESFLNSVRLVKVVLTGTPAT